MSKKSKKIVRVPEGELVTLMEGIIQEAVDKEKKKWIAEQAEKENSKIAMLEAQIKELKQDISILIETKED